MKSTLSELEPIERTETLGRRVREQLREAIMAGRFTPGQKLTIRAIAQALDVSLTPAREALYNLASDGSLHMGANGSVFVHALDEQRIVEVTKIRISLEGLAAREAARKISDEEIARIEEVNDGIVLADREKDYARLISLNWEMHFSLYRASEMPRLVRMIESCWMMTGSYVNTLYPEFGYTDMGIQNHRKIVQALKQRDAETLALAVIADINLAADSLLETIAKDGGKT